MNFFHDFKRNLLVYETQSPLHVAQLLQSLPDARQVNGSYVAVPATLKNSQTLRWMQYPVAPVITDSNYAWPAAPGIRPYEFAKAYSELPRAESPKLRFIGHGDGKNERYTLGC